MYGEENDKRSLTEILANKELNKSQRFGTIFVHRVIGDGAKKFVRYSLDFDYVKLDKILDILVENRLSLAQIYSPET